MKGFFKLLIVGVLPLALLTACGGGGGGGGDATVNNNNTTNAAPVIQSVAANPTSVQIGGSVSLSCSATDNDGDSLSYGWTATGGTLSSQTSQSVSWTAPGTSGNYTATCSVNDGEDTTSNSVAITVTPVSGSNNNPTISSVTASPTSLSTDGTATITVSASDPDGDVIGYSYSATGGSVTGNSSIATYTAPTSAGTYTIQVTVTDGRGGSATGSVSVTVTSSTGGTGGTAYEVEPNDSFNTAQTVNADTYYIGGDGGSGDDYDYFKITATGSTMTVSLTHVTQYANGSNYTVYIYTSSQSAAGYFYANTGVDNSVTIGVTSGQTYYIKVYVNNSSTYQYKVKISFGSTGNYEVEPNDSFNTAQTINADTDYIGGDGGSGDDYDYFKITATGSTMTVSFTHVTQYANGSNYTVYIYTSSQSAAGYFYANTGVDNSMTIGVTSGQTYYIKVYVNNSSTYQYKLKVSFS